MSLERTKDHLKQLLDDQDNKVIALSGKWGTGKSHLWREVKDASKDRKVKAALYVSLFGLASMDQVKLRIVQSIVGERSANWERAKKVWIAASKLIENVNKNFGAINEIALLAVPTFLKDRVIVLDDIERKHEKLSVDEVMGFIDEFTQYHGSRILMILNSDQLVDKVMWDKLREKVIDQEVRLETTPAEAFGIAVEIAFTPYADHIKKTTQSCGLTNIRIICKVIRTVNRILGTRAVLSDEVLSRVVPSTVLLAATYYKGLDNGPDFDFILKIGTLDDYSTYDKKVEDMDDPEKQRVTWRRLLHEIDVFVCDEFEYIVVDFLKSGLFDNTDVQKIIDRYTSDADTMHAVRLAQCFTKRVLWHHKVTDAELITNAQEIVKYAHLLDAESVTHQHKLISELNGGQTIADSMLEIWIETFKTKKLESFHPYYFCRDSIHLDIRAAFTAKVKSQANLTLFDACKHIAMNCGWNPEHEAVLMGATTQDFEETIRILEGEDLRLVMSKLLEICCYPKTYAPFSDSATNHFKGACRNIHNDPTVPRLAKLVEREFKNSKLEAYLTPAVAIPETISDGSTDQR